MSIKPEVTLSAKSLGALQERMTQAAIKKATRVATRAAAEMEQEVIDIVKQEFFWDRAPRRRKTQAIKLVNSFRGVVDGEGTADVTARLTIVSGASAKKIAALEHGSIEHEISSPSGFLWFPDPRQDRSKAWQAYGPNNFRTPVVAHPGNDAYHMMRRARERVRARLRTF